MKIITTLSILLLAACPLQKSVSYSGPGASGSQPATSSTTSSGSSGSSGSSAPEDPNAERARMEQYHAEQGQKNLDDGMFLRRELEALAGLTVEAAKAKAKAFGHTGAVRLTQEDDFVAGCRPNTVCKATDERGGQSGMGNEDELLLWTNKTLTISGPPE